MNMPLLLAASLYWHLPILIVTISVVYSATRFDHWGAILREAVRWGLRMAVFLVGIGLVLYVLATIPPEYLDAFFVQALRWGLLVGILVVTGLILYVYLKAANRRRRA